MTEIVTTRRSPARPKAFSWSYSKLKNFESCPKRHWHVDIHKDAREEESEQLQWGNIAHKALAARITKGVALQPGLASYEHWCQRVLSGPGTILTEQKLAITKDFGPCEFFSNDAWYRCIGDVVKVAEPVALTLDWKTGKILEDSQQLALSAACIFAHYPNVRKVRAEFIWLKEDASTRADFDRDEMAKVWKALWPRIEALEHAYNTLSYPAKPGFLCKRWCPVTTCPHHGE